MMYMNVILLNLLVLRSILENADAFVGKNAVSVLLQNQQQHQQQQQQYYDNSSRSIRKQTSVFSRRFRLHSSTSTTNSNTSKWKDDVRFLGRGPSAIVRPGCILLAPSEEYHHYLRQAAVFIYAMGTDDSDDYVIRGVIFDNSTPFSMGEMMESKKTGGVYDNLIYRGGDTGGEDAFCLHSFDTLGGGQEEIGSSKLYQGGDLNAMPDNSQVKFFFNYMEFLEQELEDMLEITHEDGDAWTSVEVPPEVVLNSDYDKSDAWFRLRNAVRGK